MRRVRLPAAWAAALALAIPCLCHAAAPEYQWAVRAGGSKHDKTRGLATDAAGNVWMTGEFGDVSTFGKFTLTSKGDLDFFVAKYSPKGECLWAQQGGGSGTDRGYAVAVDKHGNCFVTGHYQSSDATFGGGATLRQRGGYDVFTAKYDPNGKLLWLHTAGGDKYDYGHGIGTDRAGNCYVTGAVVGNSTFDDRAFQNPTGGHLFVAKYSGGGKLLWLRQGEGGGSEGESIAVDKDGNSWAAGSAGADAKFGQVSVKASGRKLLLVKHDRNGKALWAAVGTGTALGGASSVAVDAAGNSYLGVIFNGKPLRGSTAITYDIAVAKYDAGGALAWEQYGGGPGVDYCLSIAADPQGGCYATGEISANGKALFGGGRSLTSAGGQDLFVAHYDSAGRLAWLHQAGLEKNDLCYCIALDGKGSAYLSGAFDGTTKYGPSTITSVAGNDIFLAKLKLK